MSCRDETVTAATYTSTGQGIHHYACACGHAMSEAYVISMLSDTTSSDSSSSSSSGSDSDSSSSSGGGGGGSSW